MTPASDLLSRLETYVVNPAILVVFAAGFFMFLWGLVQFLWNIEEGGAEGTGKQHMLWGIVGMLVMVSVYGIIALVDNTFNLGALNGTPDMSRLNNVTFPTNSFGN